MGKLNVISGLYLISPVAVLITFVLSRLISGCVIQISNSKKEREHESKTKTSLLKCANFGIAFLYACEVIPSAIHLTAVHGKPDETIYATASLLLWVVFATTKGVRWYSHLSSSLIAAFFDTSLLALSVSYNLHSSLGKFVFAIHVSRISILFLIVVVALNISLSKGKAPNIETEPLLQRDRSNGDVKMPNESQMDDENAESEEEDEFGNRRTWNERFRDSIKEQGGGTLVYITAFKAILPYMIPKFEPRLQFCIATYVTGLGLQRLLNLLIPRQLGIITNHLADHSTGSTRSASLLALWFYLALKYFPLRDVMALAKFPVQQFTHKKLTNAVFGHILALDVDFHEKEGYGQIQRSIMYPESLQNVFGAIVNTVIPGVIDLIVALWYLGQLFDLYISYAILATAICYVSCNIRYTHLARPYRRLNTKKQIKRNDVQRESFQYWREILYFNRFNYERNRFASAIDQLQKVVWERKKVAFMGDILEEIIAGLGFGAVATAVIYLISERQMPIGSFVTLITYWSGLWSPILSLTYSYDDIARYLMEAEDLVYLFSLQPRIFDRPNAKELVITDATVTFKNVCFHYDARKRIIKDVNFYESGGTTAFVGQTGAGKTSIMKLLYRLYDPTSGSIQIDGQDIRDVTLSSLREIIGIVPQNPSLFDVSIMANVRYGRLDASDEEVMEACRAAAIHDQILSFPDGYNSIVGEKGVKLSGGELQRIAIARCILKNPKILILDEASSAVDSETEATIHKALQQLKKGRTTFSIAHRLSTIANADQILVVHEGEIVERGSHSELLQKEARYARYWDLQMKGHDFEQGEEGKDNGPLVVPTDRARQMSSETAIEGADGESYWETSEEPMTAFSTTPIKGPAGDVIDTSSEIVTGSAAGNKLEDTDNHMDQKTELDGHVVASRSAGQSDGIAGQKSKATVDHGILPENSEIIIKGTAAEQEAKESESILGPGNRTMEDVVDHNTKHSQGDVGLDASSNSDTIKKGSGSQVQHHTDEGLDQLEDNPASSSASQRGNRGNSRSGYRGRRGRGKGHGKQGKTRGK